MTKKHRQIGVAIVWNDDRSKILIDRRLPNGAFSGYWEFPGGKIEPGEDAIACIRREIREEIGIDIEVGEHLITLEHEYEEISVTLIAHHCRHIAGEPQTLQVAQVCWVDLQEMAQYTMPSANYAIVAALQEFQR